MATREDDITAWMPWFPRDFLAATAGLSAVDGWAYTQLLNHMWIEHGQLPFDHAELARLGRVTPLEWVATWGRLSRFFDVDVAAGKVTQRRLLLEREKALELRRARVEAGRQGGSAPRRAARRRSNASAEVPAQPSAPPPDSSGHPQASAKQRSKTEANTKPPPSPSPSPSPPSSPPPGSGEQTRAARSPDPPVIASSSPTPRSPSQATRKASSSDPSKARLANGPSLDAPSSTSADASPLDRALGAFAAAWEQRYREAYWPTDADRSQLGRVLRSLPDELARALPVCFTRYLADTDRFIAEKKRHSLTWFIREEGWNKYRVTVPALSAKQARTAAALAKFVNGGGDGRAG